MGCLGVCWRSNLELFWYTWWGTQSQKFSCVLFSGSQRAFWCSRVVSGAVYGCYLESLLGILRCILRLIWESNSVRCGLYLPWRLASCYWSVPCRCMSSSLWLLLNAYWLLVTTLTYWLLVTTQWRAWHFRLCGCLSTCGFYCKCVWDWIFVRVGKHTPHRRLILMPGAWTKPIILCPMLKLIEN